MAFVKVVYEKERLVVPLGSPTDKVKALIGRIAMRFRAHTGKSAEELKIVQLTTEDGFLIDPEDLVQDAILPNSILVAVDQATWLADQKSHLGKAWHYVERYDYALSYSHYLRIGLHDFGHLYISYTKKWDGPISHLELIPPSRLLNFEKEGLFDIFNIESEDKSNHWHAGAKFVVKQVGSAFVANAVVLILKSSSDPQPEVVVVQLKSEGKGLAMESALVRQQAQIYIPPSMLTYPPLTKDIIVGTSLPDAIPGCYPKTFQGNVSVVSAETSTLKLEQVEQVAMEETWRNSEGTFFNNFHTPLRISNTGSELRTIVKVESSYVDKGGLVQEAAFTRLGTKSGRWDYWYEEPPYNVQIGESSTLMCIRSSISISSPQLEKHRRIHPQLPRPLTITIRVTDDQGKVATLTVEVGQEERKLKKQSDFEEEGMKVLWFFHADETTSEERVWAAAFLERDRDENTLKISHWDGSSIYLKEANLFRYGWEAAKAGQKEYELDFKAEKQDGLYSAKFWLLVDLEKKLPYALRVALKANQSSVTAERLLPDFSADFGAK